MQDIRSYSKISERLAVLLCDRTQRNPGQSICQHSAIAEVEPPGLELFDGICEWLSHRGTPPGYNETDRSTTYPVGGCRAVGHAKFYEAERNKAMWRGEYGQERKELLRFLIRWYKERGL